MSFHLYLAAPFFSEEQWDLVNLIEEMLIKNFKADLVYGSVITNCERLSNRDHQDISLFSPRVGIHAIQMNNLIKKGIKPPSKLQDCVFADNHQHIVAADLMIAVVDDRDTGVTWEMGYAYEKTPILTFTNKNYGMNLMLSRSTDGHCKGMDELRKAFETFLSEFRVCLAESSTWQYSIEAACKTVSVLFNNQTSLSEGPSEHKNG